MKFLSLENWKGLTLACLFVRQVQSAWSVCRPTALAAGWSTQPSTTPSAWCTTAATSTTLTGGGKLAAPRPRRMFGCLPAPGNPSVRLASQGRSDRSEQGERPVHRRVPAGAALPPVRHHHRSQPLSIRWRLTHWLKHSLFVTHQAIWQWNVDVAESVMVFLYKAEKKKIWIVLK